MAHLSGYGGKVVVNSGSAFVGVAVQDWTIDSTKAVAEAYAKGETWKTKFPTVTRWSATVTTLVAADIATATLTTGTAIDVDLVYYDAANDGRFEGSGYIEGVSTADPKDGPVVATVRIKGDGTLTHATGA